FARSAEVLRTHARNDPPGDQRDRGPDPGGAGQGQGSPRGTAERAEGGSADVRRRLHATRHPERPRGVRDPGLIRAIRLLPAAAALLATLACRPAAPRPGGEPRASAAPRRVITL